MSGTEVSIDVTKARVTETVLLAMSNKNEGEEISSYEIAQGVSEIFLGLLIVAKCIDLPFSSFEAMRDIAEQKSPDGLSIVDRAAESLNTLMLPKSESE